MRKKGKTWIRIAMASVIILGGIAGGHTCLCKEERADSEISAEQQTNAVNMLNYIRALAYEISVSADNCLYLEEMYSSLLNNIHPNAVDQDTLNEVLQLLDALEGYRLISVKRERLEYLYEQSRALAVQEVVPDPTGLLSGVMANDIADLAMAVLYVAADSETSYQSAVQNAEIEYLQGNWELTDEGKNFLHESQKNLFSYMINMVDMYDLDGNLIINENMIERFVEKKAEDNVISKIQFYEANQKSYQAFGAYWLELAACYYENGEYEACLKAVETYQDLNITIFRKDYELAETLPLAILSAEKVLDGGEAEERITEYYELILEHTDEEDWGLRYFAAQTCINLAGITGNTDFLKDAYDITVNNVNYLRGIQLDQNDMYLTDNVEKEIPQDASKEQKKEIKDYNKKLKESRRTELAPLYEPLLLNCDLLFALADELEISEEERIRLDKMLHGDGEVLFLITAMDQKYRFVQVKNVEEREEIKILFSGSELIIPADVVTTDLNIVVQVDGAEQSIFGDWELESVERQKGVQFQDYTVKFQSAEAEKYEYDGTEKIIVRISLDDEEDSREHVVQFEAVREKRMDVLDEWEWLDKASDWTDLIQFEPVTK